jgi:basic membrane lipoprotein Med (substrate-binding protein (PBP1-ABC) superfamily)
MSNKFITRRHLLSGIAIGAALPALSGRVFAAGPRIKVAGIHGSPVENAWNSRIHEALKKADLDGVIEYKFSEAVSNTDYPRVMREYAEAGSRLIVGEVYGVERDARLVAKEYPKVAFLCGSSSGPQADNFGTFGTWNHEAAYLTGLLAGHMTKTGKLGAVGGHPIPEVNRLINAFRQGVREVKPDATFQAGFINTWFDPPKAKEAGLAQIDGGCDILFGERIGTADAAKERGKLAIGSLLDYMPRYPGTVIANAMWYFRPILDGILADVKAGKATGRDYSEFSFMKFDGNGVTYDAKLVPPAALKLMLAKQAAIKAGSYKVPVNDTLPS